MQMECKEVFWSRSVYYAILVMTKRELSLLDIICRTRLSFSCMSQFDTKSLKYIEKQFTHKLNIVIIYSPSCCSKPVWLSSEQPKRRYFKVSYNAVFIVHTTKVSGVQNNFRKSSSLKWPFNWRTIDGGGGGGGGDLMETNAIKHILLQ